MIDEIAEIISKISQIDKQIILKSKNILEDNILDSFHTLLLIHEIETKFNIKFDLTNNVIEIIKNVKTINKYILKHNNK